MPSTRVGKKTYFKGVIQQYSYIGDDCDIFASVGKYSSIGSKVKVVTGDHPLTFVSSSPYFYSKRKDFSGKQSRGIGFSESRQVSIDGKHYFGAIIGNDVWIGDNVLIKGGVIIGDGAVIGMGSVVTKNVEPYSIVVGNPARVIKYRFDNESVQLLLRYKWWDIDFAELEKKSLLFDNVALFLEWLKKYRSQD